MRAKGNRGGAVLWLLVVAVAAGAWAGFRVGRIYFDHNRLEHEIAALADGALAGGGNADVRAEAVRAAAFHGADVAPEAVKAEWSPDRRELSIKFDYARAADLIVARIPLRFSIDVAREAPQAAGIVRQAREAAERSGEAGMKRLEGGLDAASGKR